MQGKFQDSTMGIMTEARPILLRKNTHPRVMVVDTPTGTVGTERDHLQVGDLWMIIVIDQVRGIKQKVPELREDPLIPLMTEDLLVPTVTEALQLIKTIKQRFKDQLCVYVLIGQNTLAHLVKNITTTAAPRFHNGINLRNGLTMLLRLSTMSPIEQGTKTGEREVKLLLVVVPLAPLNMMRDKDTQAPLHLVILSAYTLIGPALEIPPQLLAIASIDNIVAVDTVLSWNQVMLSTQVDTGRLQLCILILLTAHLALCLEAQTHIGYPLFQIMNQYQTDICVQGEGLTLMESMIIVELIVAVKRKLLTMAHTIIGLLILYQTDHVCWILIALMLMYGKTMIWIYPQITPLQAFHV